MALTKCKECEKEVSTNAKTCPYCGIKDPGFRVKDMMVGLLAVIFIGWLIIQYSTNNEAPEEIKKEQAIVGENLKKITTKSETDIAFQIKPEQIVIFPKSNIACLTKEALQEVMEHGIKGEETKMKSFFLSEENPNGECIMLDANKKYKVLSSEYNNESMPEAGLIELVGAEIKSSANGAFVLIVSKDMVKIINE